MTGTVLAEFISHQYFVDCDLYDKGCNGGWPTNFFSKFSLERIFENI
jgi:hypothetical protein